MTETQKETKLLNLSRNLINLHRRFEGMQKDMAELSSIIKKSAEEANDLLNEVDKSQIAEEKEPQPVPKTELKKLVIHGQEFDAAMYSKLLDWIMTKLDPQKQVIEVAKYTKNPDKFLAHIKHYADKNRHEKDFRDISISQDGKRVTIFETDKRAFS